MVALVHLTNIGEKYTIANIYYNQRKKGITFVLHYPFSHFGCPFFGLCECFVRQDVVTLNL